MERSGWKSNYFMAPDRLTVVCLFADKGHYATKHRGFSRGAIQATKLLLPSSKTTPNMIMHKVKKSPGQSSSRMTTATSV